MSNELINLNELGIAVPEENKVMQQLTQAGSYLPQLRIYGSEASIVKEGLFPMGHFGLYYAKDKILDLDTQVDVLVVNYQPRASIMLSDEQPVNYYDPTTENFILTLEKAKAKIPGHMAGYEYLLYFPSIGIFGLFFMGNATLRRESDNVKGHIGKAATLKIKLIKTKQYTWHGCETLACTVPFDIPPVEILKEANEKFKNVTDSNLSLSSSNEEERAR